VRGKRVLDLGCGQRYPFALQLAAAGATTTALDVNHVAPGRATAAFLQTLRQNGPKRAVKSTVRRTMFDGRYYGALERAAGIPLRGYASRIQFVVADPTAATYPLPPASLDLIVSNAVLEHVQDVPRLAVEVARLLAPGGLFYAVIHNYYSLSGGHNLEWAYPDQHPSHRVPPWDHLRENRYPTWVHLNRFTPEQYRETFDAVLDVVHFQGIGLDHDPDTPEGESLLTPELARELSQHPRERLLTRSWCMICKRR
jgi:SAM-dependent methyltransferase